MQLRELLHVQVSAAALSGGKGKMVEDLDKELASRSAPAREVEEVQGRRLEGQERDAVAATFAEAMAASKRRD